jgi:hypothetical protein
MSSFSSSCSLELLESYSSSGSLSGSDSDESSASTSECEEWITEPLPFLFAGIRKVAVLLSRECADDGGVGKGDGKTLNCIVELDSISAFANVEVDSAAESVLGSTGDGCRSVEDCLDAEQESKNEVHAILEFVPVGVWSPSDGGDGWRRVDAFLIGSSSEVECSVKLSLVADFGWRD